MKSLKETVFAIVGMGLMGGSFAMALREQNARQCILAITQGEEERDKVLTRGIADQATVDLSLARQADVIVLATPVRTIIDLLPRVGAIAKPGAIILDVGSTKRAIVAAMNDLPAHLQPVGGHPMCGKEVSGLDAAHPHLFQNAPFVFTPLERTLTDTLQLVRDLARALGAHPILLDADTHDRTVAAVSHLPSVLAAALMATVLEQEPRDLIAQLAAGGFRDTSRLASSDSRMQLDILLTNRDNLIKLIHDAADQLNQIATWLEAKNEESLQAYLAMAAEGRQRILSMRSE